MSVYYLNTATTAETIDDPESPSALVVDEKEQTKSEAQIALGQFWPKVLDEVKSIKNMDWKVQVLPLARIKKIMKLDEDVKMISAEAPLLFAKAAEIFIQELTLRAWIHTEDNKRRTLQRNDIAMAISKYDQFDFLIDIVPREEIKMTKPKEDQQQPLQQPQQQQQQQSQQVITKSPNNSDQVYYFQLAQQAHANLQQSATATATATATSPTAQQTPQGTIQIVQPQVQTVQIDQSGNASNAQAPLLIQAPQQIAQPQALQGNVQIFQQVVTANGEIQQIPINLNPQQLQMIKMQLQGNSTQPVIIQTAPQPHLIQVAQQSAQPQQVFLTQTSNGSTESE